MNPMFQLFLRSAALIFPLLITAQTAHIDFATQHQRIRGFGAVDMPDWINGLSVEEVDRAFGAGDGQLGFTILRIKVPVDRGQWSKGLEAAVHAKSMGAIILASPWSPPAHMKTNGNIVGGELLPEYYQDYAQHLADFANYMKDNGAELYAISIQNEPDIRVDYESCDWTPAQMIDFLKNHASIIPCRVVAPESFRFDRSKSDPILRDPEAAAEVDIIGGHIYGGGLYAYPLAERLNKEVWMTEHLELEIDWASVLATGKEIHDCMASNFNAYLWWYLRRFYGPLAEDGSVSQRGYVMSHFSRFVRPGWYRVEADSTPAQGVFVSAFRDTESATIVIINRNPSAQSLSLVFEGGTLGQLNRWESTAAHNVTRMEAIEVSADPTLLSLPPQSITTLAGPLRSETTLIHPVLPGNHPDPVILQDGEDFYLSGSSRHPSPFGEILHSRDLMHWETLSHVIPANRSAWIADQYPGAEWQGVITRFHGSFRFYFSNLSHPAIFACTADSPGGPWSDPIQIGSIETPSSGGTDISVFVDDDGTPYLLSRSASTNRIHMLGADGHPTNKRIELDWMLENPAWNGKASPVLIRKDGWYYYFTTAGESGVQHVLRTRNLTASPGNWQSLGACVEPISEPEVQFRLSTHMTAPVQIQDGSWWTLSHSFRINHLDDWSGFGRQGLLHSITWSNDGMPIISAPTLHSTPGPSLMSTGIPRRSTRSDWFETGQPGPHWFFQNTSDADRISLSEKAGWLFMDATNGKTHILQRETETAYSVATLVSLQADAPGQRGGISLTNPDGSLAIELYSGFSDGRNIGVNLFGDRFEIDNPFGDSIWLKLERNGHLLNAYYSPNGVRWDLILRNIDLRTLDMGKTHQPQSAGNTIGLFSEGTRVGFFSFQHSTPGEEE